MSTVQKATPRPIATFTRSLDPSSLKPHASAEEGRASNPGAGQAQDANTAFLSGERKPLRNGDQETHKSSFDKGTGFIVNAAVITGMRYGDTFMGNRINEGAGAGIFSTNNFAGGGDGEVSYDHDAARARTEAAARAAQEMGLITGEQYRRMTDGTVSSRDARDSKDAAASAAADGDQAKAAAASELASAVGAQLDGQSLWSSVIEAIKDAVKMPKDDGDVTGGYVPIPIGQGRTPVKETNQAGGPNDGRGTAPDSGQGPSWHSSQAIAGHFGRDDKEMKVVDAGGISLETALAANRFTDPGRG
ncbi:MAG: hypothetical protein U1E65_16765 [Myxococcota bacterium]